MSFTDDDATPSSDQQPDDTAAVRRRTALFCILAGLAILAYVVPELFAGLRARDAAADKIKAYAHAIEAPSESFMETCAYTARAQDWIGYQASVTRIRIDGVIAFLGGVSLTAGLKSFLTRNREQKLGRS